MLDVIRINNLSLAVAIKQDLSPVLVTVSFVHNLRHAAERDDLQRSIDYSTIHSAILRIPETRSEYISLDALADHILEIVFGICETVQEATVKVVQMLSSFPRASIGIQVRRLRTGGRGSRRQFLRDLVCNAIVGVNPSERVQKQPVRVNISLECAGSLANSLASPMWSSKIHDVVSSSSFFTLEALSSLVARETLRLADNLSSIVTVSAAKPEALNLADSAEVEIVRSLVDYPHYFSASVPGTVLMNSKSVAEPTGQDAGLDTPPAYKPIMSLLPPSPRKQTSSAMMHKVMLGIGTNMGDRFANVELALRMLEVPQQLLRTRPDAELSILDTSFMYETAPMYVTDQSMFINCACVAETNLSPRELLTLVKTIEEEVGRVPSIRFGPRAIDLDILTYGSDIIDSRHEQRRDDVDDDLEGELLVPHPRLTEREFVLRPMADMMPEYIHPIFGKTILTLLQQVTKSQSPGYSCMRKVIPFPSHSHPSPFPSSHSMLSFPSTVPPTLGYWKYPSENTQRASRMGQKTYLMATLNVTPDSFSDGSLHSSLPAAISFAQGAVAAGSDIIDIGGYSTRPGAGFVSPEDEISRVVPVIKALRSLPSTQDALISVDTFRADVAKEAVLAGANCINDVYAFSGPNFPLTPESAEHLITMRQVARELAVPVVLMHSRGDAGSNKDYQAYVQPGGDDAGVLEGVRVELGDKVDAIVRGPNGVRRWLVIVDPGVGFSKDVDGNLDVIRRASTITADMPVVSAGGRRNALAGYPMLIGPSRKRFVGKILERSDAEGGYEGRKTVPKERGWGTAAAVACAVLEGALVVRVHDVLEMGDVIRVASALRER